MNSTPKEKRKKIPLPPNKKDSFRMLFSFFLEHTPMEKIDEFGMSENYFVAVDYYAQKYGTHGKKLLHPEDIEILLALQDGGYHTIISIAAVKNLRIASATSRIQVLIKRAYVSYFVEKDNTKYYRITPYGKKQIEEMLAGKRL